MNMVDLIVFVCLITNANACEEHHLLFQSQGSLRACMMQAPPYLAQWIGEHPKFRVVRWRCDWPDREGENS